MKVYVIIKDSEDDSSTIWDIYDNEELALCVAPCYGNTHTTMSEYNKCT